MAHTISSTPSSVFATFVLEPFAMNCCAQWRARCGIGGVVVVEMRFFRGYTAATIPAPHVPWSAEECDATVDAGAADVCPTPDELHLVYDDFSRYFEDLRFQFVEVPPSLRDQQPSQLFVSGSVRGDLVSRIHAVHPVAHTERQR